MDSYNDLSHEKNFQNLFELLPWNEFRMLQKEMVCEKFQMKNQLFEKMEVKFLLSKLLQKNNLEDKNH